MSRIELSHIFIYPVKSISGISLSISKITPAGLKNDRRWMIINDKNMFVTQRLHPELSLININLEENMIQLTAPDMSSIHLPVELIEGDSVSVRIWSDTVDGISAEKEHNDWISRYLGIKARFVYMPDTTRRQVDQGYAKSPADRVSFADGFPFLLLSEESVDNLNTRLNKKNELPVTIKRFRPNFVIRGCTPHAEDDWKNFRISGNYFHMVKPCSRCIMTTVNADTGKKGVEPLRTLLEYRKQGDKSYFGQNVLIDLDYKNSWLIKTGDEIILE